MVQGWLSLSSTSISDMNKIELMRDYNYLEHTGMGVPRKIIKGMMEHNGTQPDLVEEEEQFTVRLWK